MNAPEPAELIICTACAAAGRHARPLTDPLSRILRMGPTCARRAAAGSAAAAAALQLAFDLELESPPGRRGELVPA